MVVVQEYFERYEKFINKMKVFLSNKKIAPSYGEMSELVLGAETISNSLITIEILDPDQENHEKHNIGLDFLITMVILLRLLGMHSLDHFAQFSSIEIIVENNPVTLPLSELK